MTTKIKTEVIDNYRKKNNLTVEQFCKKSGISYGTYRRLIQQQTRIRLTVIIKVLNTINIKSSDLIETE